MELSNCRYHGAGFKAKNEFAVVASADEWFSPVAADVGPDGNLWIADWYNFIVQHNATPSESRCGYNAQTGKGNAYVNQHPPRRRVQPLPRGRRCWRRHRPRT